MGNKIHNLPSEDLFIVSDLHFNHRNLFNWGDRPIDFDDKLWMGLEEIASDQNSLINLGDITFGSQEQKIETVKRYNDLSKHFKNHYYIYGNHCLSMSPNNPTEEKLEIAKPKYFMEELDGFKSYRADMEFNGVKILFSHLPQDMVKYSDYDYNIVGHMHTIKNAQKDDSENRVQENKSLFTNKHILISMEYQNLKPVKLSYILNNIEDFKIISLIKKFERGELINPCIENL